MKCVEQARPAVLKVIDEADTGSGVQSRSVFLPHYVRLYFKSGAAEEDNGAQTGHPSHPKFIGASSKETDALQTDDKVICATAPPTGTSALPMFVWR